MSEQEFAVMYGDLTEDCQKRLLKFFRIKHPDEMNWDAFPVTTIPDLDFDEQVSKD